MFYTLLKPLLFCLDPEKSHVLTLRLLKLVYRPWLVRKLQRRFPQKNTTVLGIQFPNRVGLAAGFDKNADYLDPLFGLGFGFIEVGGVTPKPQSGNPKPRLFRLQKANALINRMGFNNKGVDYLVERLKHRRVPGVVGVNIAKNRDTPLNRALDDYLACLEKTYAHADFFTVNISSPNTPGLRELQSEEYLNTLLQGLTQERNRLCDHHRQYKPLLVKLSIDIDQDQLAKIVQTLLENKIEGVVCSNTSLDHQAVAHLEHGNEQGGLSGQPIFEKTKQMVQTIHRLSKGRLVIIAVGGILSGQDAQAMFDAGASLVQLYTGLVYRGPALVKECIAIQHPV